MQPSTVHTLDEINQRFYYQTAPDFAATRWKEWPGWRRFLPYIVEQDIALQKSTANPQLHILDVGCGGGRLARFLHANCQAQSIVYTGIDRDQQLLDISQKLAPTDSARWQTQFHQLNLVEALLNNNLIDQLNTACPTSPRIIALIAVLHHIPSFDLRLKLVQDLLAILPQDGLLIFNTWQFLNSVALRDRVVDPAKLGLKDLDLEENDFILDWRLGQTAYRYCHYFNNDEEVKLLKQLNARVIDDFFADGVTRNMNHYYILRASDTLI